LFKGYAVLCSDKEFVNYIKRKYETYEEGTDIDPDDLMKLADMKYKILKEAGKWNAPSPGEEKILALEAQIKGLKRQPKKRRQANKVIRPSPNTKITLRNQHGSTPKQKRVN
jgi:hypothetical protein